MPVSISGLSEVASVLEEVASSGETAEFVDLSAVSQQLDFIIHLQQIQVLCLGLIAGAIIGVAVAMAIGRLCR